MYKVFVNERPFVLTTKPLVVPGALSVAFQNAAQLKILVHQLKSTTLASSSINVYAEDIDALWASFCSLFTVIEAAGGIVQNPQGNYLFIKRLGLWDLPKGKLDKGETLEQAAVREVEEECGISGLTITTPAGQTFHTYEYKGGDALKISHWFKMQTDFAGNLIPQTEEDITEAKWLTKAEVREVVLADTYVSIAELVKREIL